MLQPTPGEVFNLVDDDPSSRAAALQFAAAMENIPLLPDAFQAPVDAISSSEKRVSNAKAKRLLGWELRYPSYCDGLTAIHASNQLA
jgi:nucleoside-diphosphate-sugar epimerase